MSYRKVFVGSRLCALKMMLHLSKNRDVSVALARTEIIPLVLVNIANKNCVWPQLQIWLVIRRMLSI